LNEVLEKDAHWWERWLQDMRPYRTALQAAMCEIAQEGNFVYHGHIGHELLPQIRHVLKVMLTAPFEFRINEIQSQHGLDEAGARDYIDRVDAAGTRRLVAMFRGRLAGHNAIRSRTQCGPTGDRRCNTGHC